eukprot:153841_1
MPTLTVLRQQFEWIFDSVIGLIVFIINFAIFKKEWKKRKSKKIIFISKTSQISSLLCFIFGTLFGLFLFVMHLNGFCYFAYQVNMFCFFCAGFGIGIYQMARLYYCFANAQVYHNKGYPNWIFITMSLIAVLTILSTIVYSSFMIRIPVSCGINKQFQYVARYSDSEYSQISAIFLTIIMVIWIACDLINLFLYIFKVISFRKYKSEQPSVYNRIMSILNRVVILTLLYEMIALICFGFFLFIRLLGNDESFARIVFWICMGVLVINMNYSMFLKQQHNTSKYHEFLNLLYNMKLISICCCCFKSVITEEIKLYSEQSKSEKNIDNIIKDDHTSFETRDVSVKNKHSIVKELSIETCTAIQK